MCRLVTVYNVMGLLLLKDWTLKYNIVVDSLLNMRIHIHPNNQQQQNLGEYHLLITQLKYDPQEWWNSSYQE